MPSPFQDRTIGYIRSVGSGIEDVATTLGTSPNAIAGAIANEFDSRLTSGFFSILGDPAQKAADVYALLASEARLHASFDDTLNLTDAQIQVGGLALKLANPVLIDVGPGNISIRTAIKLLDEYAAQNPSDPLNILHYRNDYSLLVRDLADWGGETTGKFAGLMVARGQEFFETHAANWNSLSIDQKDALLVSYYKLGQEHFEQDYLATANTGSPYNPVVGDIGQLHIVNANTLLLALGGVTQIPIFRPEGVETIAVSADAARAVLGYEFDGTAASAARWAAAAADGSISISGDFVSAIGIARYTAPFDNNPNKIVISGDESGLTSSTVSNNFLQHITALPIDGTRIDTAFSPDGSRLVTTTDLPNFYGWDREIQSIHPDGLTDNIVVNDDGTVGLATYYGNSIAGDIGAVFGSSLGRLLGGNSLVGQLATGTVIGAIGKEVGNALSYGGSFSLDVVVKDAFGTLGGGGGIGALPSGAIGAASSLLMSELAHALHLNGFEGGLFTTVGATITTQLVTNAYGVATGATWGPDNLPYTMFTGFDSGAIFLQLEGAVAGYLGSTLAAHIAMPHYAEGAIGQQVGSSVGGLIGTAVLPVIGTFIGSFVGGVVGSIIGDLAGHDPESHGRMVFAQDHRFYPDPDSFYGDHGANGYTFMNIATYTALTVDALSDFAGVQMNATPVTTGHLAPPAGLQLVYTQQDKAFWIVEPGQGPIAAVYNVHSADDLAPLVNTGIMKLVHDVQVLGGDPLERLAWQNSHAGNPSAFALDLQVAKDYCEYLDDKDAINALMAREWARGRAHHVY